MSARVVVEFTEEGAGVLNVDRYVEESSGTEVEIQAALELFTVVDTVILEAKQWHHERLARERGDNIGN